MDASWFIDGSLHDAFKVFGSALGFGVVIVSAEGDLLAVGCGRPPVCIWDAAGAELWAFYFVVSTNPFVPKVYTDCKGVLDGWQEGFESCTTVKKKLARTWRLIGAALDFNFEQAASLTTWMPAHGSIHTIGVALDSNSRPITPLMWRANRLVDLAAKAAAHKNRLPNWVINKTKSIASFVRYHGALLGHVTWLANNHESIEVDDLGRSKSTFLRDSTGYKLMYRAKGSVDKAGVCVDSSDGVMARCKANDANVQPVSHLQTSLTRVIKPKGLCFKPASGNQGRKQHDRFVQIVQLREQQQLKRSLDAKCLRPAAGPSASQRLQLLKDRLFGAAPHGDQHFSRVER